MNNTSVESYLAEGCGRCKLFQTPECKVHLWTDGLIELRKILLESGLDEDMKWGSPCYSLNGQNVVMLTSFREHFALGFFKGAALPDVGGELASPGPNSRFLRRLSFTSFDDLMARRQRAVDFIKQAIKLERAGIEVDPGETEPMPIELEQRLAADADLQAAFDSLTPGRQRSFILYVSGAKQSATRESRAERCEPKIYAGKGYNER